MADSRSTRPRIHLINPLWDPNGGADWRTVDTWRLLRDVADVDVWSEFQPHRRLLAECPARRLQPWRLAFPRTGTLVFVGTYFRVGHWVRMARPDRSVILYNTHQPDRLAKNVERIAHAGVQPEIVYTSHALKRMHGGTGPVLESPIDVQRFRPRESLPGDRPFTVGRLSRDLPSKHHQEDPALWRALAAAGCNVRILGGTCLAPQLAGTPGIELLPAGAEEPAAFLRSLDCFVYRTSTRWFEAYGRVVMEAMATGLPVVASSRGGYVEGVREGCNGLLFDTTQQALEQVRAVRADKALAARLGTAARRTAVTLNVDHLPQRTRALLGASTVDAAPVAVALAA